MTEHRVVSWYGSNEVEVVVTEVVLGQLDVLPRHLQRRESG